MKKVYEKPQVYMERFELAEHIAGCNLTPNNDGSGTMNGFIEDDYYHNVFLEGMKNCKTEVESYCYTNGSINNATITS